MAVNVSKCNTGVVKYCGRNLIFTVAGAALIVIGIFLAILNTTTTGTWPDIVITVSALGWLYWILFFAGIVLLVFGMFNNMIMKKKK